MEIKNKKCSLKEHSDIDAIIICVDCNLNLCKECEIFHSNFCKEHKTYNLEKDYKEIFSGYCQENNHQIKLEYFCRTHNILCCAKCITKIKNKKNGEHTDCDICNIEEILEEKTKQFKENLLILDELSKTLQTSISNLKNIAEKVEENKEEIKLKIQKSFSKIRNELNNKEDELLLEVDNIYSDIFFTEDSIREMEKLPKKIKLASQLGHISDRDKKGDNLISLINDCLKIENYIKEINLMNEKINNNNNFDILNIEFVSKDESINEEIKNFGYFRRNIIPEFLKSSIIKGDSKNQNLIYNWIKSIISREQINFELIFKMSENGSNSSIFHQYCNDKGPTLTLILTTQEKKFGGFTPLNWKSEGGFINDSSKQTFIFSLNLGKKFELIDNEKSAIKFDSNNGPNFGNGDIIIYQNMTEGKTYANDKSTFLKDNNLELIAEEGEQQSFNVKEIEVYRVFY